jgi:short-subunit dehydrogenase
MIPAKPHAVITGATRGIGRAIAENLGATHRLTLLGRDEQKLRDMADRFEGARFIAADLRQDLDSIAQELAQDPVDVLVHSAGVSTRGGVDTLDREQWQDLFELNLFAVTELTRLLIPALRQTRGTLIFINSGAGLFTSAGNGLYAASKHALRAYADAVRIEEREKGIRVTSIHPGFVATDLVKEIADHEGVPYQPERYLEPSSIAASVRYVVEASEEAMIESISIRPRIPVVM